MVLDMVGLEVFVWLFNGLGFGDLMREMISLEGFAWWGLIGPFLEGLIWPVSLVG